MAERPTSVRFMITIITYCSRWRQLAVFSPPCFDQHMLSVTKYDVGDVADFPQRMSRAMAAFAANQGCLDAWAGPCTDEPGVWILTLRFDSLGSYRRALSSFRVKTDAVPLMYLARDEPSGFETSLALENGQIVEHNSDVDASGLRTATAPQPPAGTLDI